MSPANIAVIGSINEDFIIHEGKERHSYGGILYNLVALASLLPEAKIQPIAFLGKNVRPAAVNLSRKLANLDWSAAPKLGRKSNRVRLFYLPDGEKRELLKHPVPAFIWRHIAAALNTEALLVNFISGWEISPRLFQKLRRSFPGPIHADLHSLLLGIGKDGRRFRRLPENWPCFLDADFVQMNEREWEQVAGRPFNRANLLRFCRQWRNREWQALLVTRAEKGAVMAWRNGAVKIISCPAPRVWSPEQTGAGDFFAAGFLSAWLEGRSLRTALRKAVRTASWKCRYEGIESVLRHRKELRRFLTTPK